MVLKCVSKITIDMLIFSDLQGLLSDHTKKTTDPNEIRKN